MYALNKTASNAFVVSGGSAVTADCGALVRSDSSSGLVVSGSLSSLTATTIGVVAAGYSAGTGAITPTPMVNVAPFGDPLASARAPTVGAIPSSCTTSPDTSAGHGYSVSGGAPTISAGTYCGGITVSGGTTLHLNPGTYILYGGGLTVSGGSNLVGNGVTFYNTGTTSGSSAYKPIVFSGGSTTSLMAPTSGSLAGILFFQDRSITSTSQNTISGGGGAVFQGALYFATTPLVYSGGSGVSTAPLPPQ